MTAILLRVNIALALWGWLDALDDICSELFYRFRDRDREPEHEGFTEEFSIREWLAEVETDAIEPKVIGTAKVEHQPRHLAVGPRHMAVEPPEPTRPHFDVDPLSPLALAPVEPTDPTPLFDEVWAEFYATAPEGALAA